MSATATGPLSKSSLAAQLGRVYVGLREDLEVTRHVFRGEPAYVVRDPITFTSQRLERRDYDVYVSIDSGRPLGEIFRELMDRGKLAVEDEERFFQFVVTLHRLGFLRLPVNDDRLLYRRHVARKDAAGRGRIMNLLFLRVPLWIPDAFLSRTVRFTWFLFTPWFLFLWLGWVGAALYVVFANWHDLNEPVSGVLAAANLPLLWVTLVVLKILHEFGHAYACKHYGGHVPEM
jgi:putative peptide zinc metalloprotease protein